MRRQGHPSRPRAMTCCFFASLKTLLIPTKATALRRNQRPRASFSLAGFEVTLIGRFWVTPEGQPNQLDIVGPSGRFSNFYQWPADGCAVVGFSTLEGFRACLIK